MEPVLYHAMHGSKTGFERESITANNLANSNTPGFKADLHQAQSMYFTGTENLGPSMSVTSPNTTDFSPGDLMNTGGNLDVAIQGEGWFAIQDAGGREAYTRSGSFKLTDNGMLVTAAGLPVIGDGGPISIPPAKHVEIGVDGTISIVPLGSDAKTMAVIDRLKLVKIDKSNLVKTADGLIRMRQGKEADSDPDVKVVSGTLEGSNVNPVEQMVSMIAAGREFEGHMKLLQTVDENTQKLAQLLQL